MNAAINIVRGNEKSLHRESKSRYGEIGTLKGWNVFYEWHCCDIVFMKVLPSGKMLIIGVEIENSTRNVIPNLRRNFRNGCNGVVIVAKDLTLKLSIERLLSRRGSEFADKVHVVINSAR